MICKYQNCSGLTTVNITDLTAWCNISFYGSTCNPLYYAHHLCLNGQEITNLVIPNSVTSIGSYAFCGCSGLTSVTIPNSVTSIGESAFSDCTSLTSITIPESMEGIGPNAFSGTPWFDNLPDGVIYIGKVAYKYKGTMPEGVQIVIAIKEGTTQIADYAFENCTAITSVTIPNSLTSIGNCAFEFCTGLTTIAFGNSVKSIGYDAFQGCSSLTSVTIPNSVTSIGDDAFYNCKLRNVLIKCITPPEIHDGTFSRQTLYHTTLYVPTGSWDAYAYDEFWYKFINIRETALTEEQVSEQQAYTLMDAETFVYSVYDPVNDCINTINSVGINEDNPNHSWQMMEANGVHYLYNIGARKYVKRNGNSLELTDVPVSIDVEDGDNGLILGAQTDKRWALVSNESMSVAQSAINEVTGIRLMEDGRSKMDAPVYNLSGQQVGKPQKGINIIRMSDGTTKKILVK